MSVGGNLSETDQMKRRITAAFDVLEGPEAARLMALESVVVARARSVSSKQRQRKNRLWWIGGLLILSAASAAWWQVARHAVNQSPAAPERATEQREAGPIDPRPIDLRETGGQANEQPAPERQSPVIFRR